MKFQVELLAFGKPSEIREVDVPTMVSMKPESLSSLCNNNQDARDIMLGLVFKYGQNEAQPQNKPSVSAGDVIHMGEDRWLVMAAGFHKMTPQDYELYKTFDQSTRIQITFETQHNYELISKYADRIRPQKD